MRVHRFGCDSPAMSHLLASFEYSEVSVGKNHTWFVRTDAPVELSDRIRTAPPPPQRLIH